MGLGLCGECGSSFRVKVSNAGPVLDCPKCGSLQQVTQPVLEKIIDKDLKCPKHRVKLVLKTSARGFFMECPLYPKCTHTQAVSILPEFSK